MLVQSKLGEIIQMNEAKHRPNTFPARQDRIQLNNTFLWENLPCPLFFKEGDLLVEDLPLNELAIALLSTPQAVALP